MRTKLGPKPQPGTPEYREYFSKMGKLGGDKTKARKLKDDPDYYSRIGLRGGNAMKETRGREFYSTIGKIGSHKQWHGEDEA